MLSVKEPCSKVKVQVSSYPEILGVKIKAWTDRQGFGRLELPEFVDSPHMKVARSALRTGRVYFSVLISVRG